MGHCRAGGSQPLVLFWYDEHRHPRLVAGDFFGDDGGDILPANVVSALSVGLYGMFLAVIIPAARKSKLILGVVAASMAASFLLESLPIFAGIASGTKLILLTVVLSAGAALLFPVKDEEPGEEETP